MIHTRYSVYYTPRNITIALRRSTFFALISSSAFCAPFFGSNILLLAFSVIYYHVVIGTVRFFSITIDELFGNKERRRPIQHVTTYGSMFAIGRYPSINNKTQVYSDKLFSGPVIDLPRSRGMLRELYRQGRRDILHVTYRAIALSMSLALPAVEMTIACSDDEVLYRHVLVASFSPRAVKRGTEQAESIPIMPPHTPQQSRLVVRIFGDSKMCKSRVERVKQAFLLVAMWTCFATGRAWGSDPYLDQALNRIGETLLHPPASYGLLVTDVLTSASGTSDKYREELYVLEGRPRWRHEPFDSAGSSRPSLQVLTVTLDPMGNAIQSIYTGKDRRGCSVLRMPSVRIGQCDPYTFSDKPEENASSPAKQPYQIMANPCFAPLGLTPDDLRALPSQSLPGADGLRSFEFRIESKEGEGVRVLRLSFSPEQDDLLARSEDFRALVKPNGELNGVGERVIRLVETWQQLDGGGGLVPARYTVRHEDQAGNLTLGLVRDVSTPVIGNVSPLIFNWKGIAEFKGLWDSMVDLGSNVTIITPRSDPEVPVDRMRIVFTVLNVGMVVAVIACLSWYYWRQRRTKRSRVKGRSGG